MKILSNLAGSYVTSDEVADAVVAYHGSLESLGAVDLLDVPVLDNGQARLAPIAVGALTRVTASATLPTEPPTVLAVAALAALAERWNPPQE
jgi:hypothetical protein